MSNEWQYQVRFRLSDEHADLYHSNSEDPAFQALADILQKHKAQMKSQYSAFAGYVEEAETRGRENYPLYEWTKATIENPAKRDKYQKSFTVYVEGQEVYEKTAADSLEAELQALVGQGVVTQVAKHDTNPENNPQMPERYRK